MAENKTRPTRKSVSSFLETIEIPQRKADCRTIAVLMEELTMAKPKCGVNLSLVLVIIIIDIPVGEKGIGFCQDFLPRKQYLTLYIMGYLEFHEDILKDLGKYKHGKGCLYIKKLEDIDMMVLKTLIKASIQRLKREI